MEIFFFKFSTNFYITFVYFHLCEFIFNCKNLFLFIIACENLFLFMIICENLFFFARILSYSWSSEKISSFLWESFWTLLICENLFLFMIICENLSADFLQKQAGVWIPLSKINLLSSKHDNDILLTSYVLILCFLH